MDNCGECAELLQEGCEEIIGVCPESPVVKDYNALANKPSINGVTLIGNKTSEDLGITQQITEAVQAEAEARQTADEALQQEIDGEETARANADTALDGRITANANAISDEALARQSADNGLQTQIDAITSKSDVVDVVANYAALQAYDTSTLGNNDVVKVLDDETHEDALTYYRWSTTTQTWSYIGQEAPYYSKGQMDVMLQGKQDTLTAGDNIQIQNGTISATDTTYTAGNGLNLNGTEFSADTDVLATKEDLEGYYTKPEADNLLAPKLEAEVVAELPATGEEGKLYLTPKAHTTQTATGNPITATVAEEAGAIESFQLDGDTFQQSYEGKNLLKMAGNWAIVQGSGATVTDGDDGSIILNGTVVTRQDIRVYSTSDRLRVESGTEVTLSRNTNNYNLIWHRFTSEEAGTTSDVAYITANGAYSHTYTVASTDYGYQFVLRLLPGTVFDNEKIYLQLEKGSTATSYEKFVGGQPSPSPDYPQPIQTVTGLQTVEIHGKNQYPFNDTTWSSTSTSATWCFQDGASNAYGANVVDKTEYKLTLPAGTYTVSAYDISSNLIRIQVVSNGESVETLLVNSITSENPSATITLTEPTTICVRYRPTTPALGIGDTKIQIEKAESASSFAPYSKQSYPLDLGTIELCGLGDDGNGNPLYKDYIYPDGDDWKVHKATASDRMSSTDNWVIPNPSAYPNLFQAVINRLDLAPEYVLNSSALEALCDELTYMDSGAVRTVQGFAVYNNEGSKLVRINIANFTTVAQLKDWLSSNDIEILFALATPTDTTITDQTLIAQLEAIRTASLQNGANTITNTATGSNLAGDMEVGYYGFAPRNRYDKWLWLDINNEYEQIGS